MGAVIVMDAYCFKCFRELGKKERKQPHRATPSSEYEGWWELTCLRCNSKCYTREEEILKFARVLKENR